MKTRAGGAPPGGRGTSCRFQSRPRGEGSRGVRLVALAVVASLATGCADLFDEITLNADGSGTYRIVVIAPVKDANLEEIRSAAEKRAREIAGKAGFTLRSVDVVRGEHDLVAIEAKADFASPAVFANPALSVGQAPGGVSWSFVTPREIRFDEGVFSARVLRGSAPPRGDLFRARLKGHHARFTVHLPGEVSHADGARSGSSVTWRFSLDHLCDEPVSMNAEAKAQSMTGTLLLGALLLTGLAVMIVSLFKKRRA